MTAAVASAPLSARQRITAEGRGINTAPNVDMPRFFVQMGWSKLEVDTEAIPGKTFLRGEITPCRSHRQKSNFFEIPEGMRIPGMDQADPASGDNKVVWGFYWKHAQDEATRLAELESRLDPSHRMAIVEIKSLSGLRSVYYDEYDFNEIFYPQGLNALPVTNAALKAHLQARLAEIQSQPLPLELKPVLLDLGAELIAACDVAERAQSERVDFSHRCMQLSPTDSSGFYKKTYDELDEEALLRTGKPRVGEALEVQAKALDLLAQDKANPSKNDPVFAMVKAQQEGNEILRAELAAQREQTNQLLQVLMKQNGGTADVSVEPPPSKKK